MSRAFLATATALLAATMNNHRLDNVWKPGITWQGHEYPINNKKGFAAKDKRRSKKRRGGR